MEIRKSHLTFILGEFLLNKPDQHQRFCELVLEILKTTYPDITIRPVAENLFLSNGVVFFIPQEITPASIIETVKNIASQELSNTFQKFGNAEPTYRFFLNTNKFRESDAAIFANKIISGAGLHQHKIRLEISPWDALFPFLEKNPLPFRIILEHENNEALPSRKYIFDIWRNWLDSTIETTPLAALGVLNAWIRFSPESAELPAFIARWLKFSTNQHTSVAVSLYEIYLQKDLPFPLIHNALLHYLEKNYHSENPAIKRIFLSLARRNEHFQPFAHYIKFWLEFNFNQKYAGPVFATWIRQGLPTTNIEPEMASWILSNSHEIAAGPVFVELLATGYKDGVTEQKLMEWIESANGLTPEAGAVYYNWLQLGTDNETIKNRMAEWRLANPNHPDIYRIEQLVRGAPAATEKFYPDTPITLQSLRLSHVRKYANFEAMFTPPAAPGLGQWVVILGENGVGKTTLLRSIVLTLRNVEKRDTWPPHAFTDWENVNTPDGTKPEIKVETNNKPYLTHIPAPGEVEQEPRMENNSVYPLFAYGCRRGSALGGALRAVEMGGGMEVATLFDEGAALVHAETWLKELDGDAAKSEQGKALFDSVITALKSMLMVDKVFVKDMLVWVQEAGKQAVPFRYLSDAYLTTAGWFLDLLARWLHMARQENIPVNANFMAEMRGLVLIDEIDLHLHPRLQIDIIPRTRKLLPQMSFVVTTHNALTLLGAQPEEIRILREEAGVLTMTPGVEPPQLLTPAQILHSYFGIDGYRPSEIGRALKRYAFLADFAMRNDEEEAELQQLRDTLAAANSLPDWEITPRESLDEETTANAGVAGEGDDTPA